MNVVEWRLSSFEDASAELWPSVDGRPLSDLAEDYERSQGYDDPAGGYAGLVLDDYRFADLRSYLSGEQRRWPGERVPLLGCECGEWGCWPLVGRISHDAGTVRWDRFEQPHRRDRRYDSFGPFVFDGAAYRQAVEQAVRRAADRG